MHGRYNTAPLLAMVLLLLLLVLTPVEAAISPEADAAIKAAIKAAVEDALSTIDVALRDTYWYYLQGANLTSYNVSIVPDRLNFVIVYEHLGNIFSVNCDLIKQTWKPRLNSFVKLVSGAPANAASSLAVGQLASAVDLTDQASFNQTVLQNAKQTGPSPIPTPQLIILNNLPSPNLTSSPSN